MEIKTDNSLSEMLTKRSTGLTTSQVKDLVISIGTEPDPIEFPDIDEFMENILGNIKDIQKDNINMRKKNQ